jgi:hypothetical protein
MARAPVSKSGCFARFVNGYSENSFESRFNQSKYLDTVSECNASKFDEVFTGNLSLLY